MFKELIDVVRLERRVQAIENILTIALKQNELNSLRLELQLGRITELEIQLKTLQRGL